jgi:hypothetical protein
MEEEDPFGIDFSQVIIHLPVPTHQKKRFRRGSDRPTGSARDFIGDLSADCVNEFGSTAISSAPQSFFVVDVEKMSRFRDLRRGLIWLKFYRSWCVEGKRPEEVDEIPEPEWIMQLGTTGL